MLAYAVVIPPALRTAYAQLPSPQRLVVGLHLVARAEAAAVSHELGEDASPWSDLAGLSKGVHRVLLDGLWLAYRVVPEAAELRLLDFGRAELHSHAPAAEKAEAAEEDEPPRPAASGPRRHLSLAGSPS